MIGTIPSAATGSAHHQPRAAFRPTPASAMTDKLGGQTGGDFDAAVRPETHQGDASRNHSGADRDDSLDHVVTDGQIVERETAPDESEAITGKSRGHGRRLSTAEVDWRHDARPDSGHAALSRLRRGELRRDAWRCLPLLLGLPRLRSGDQAEAGRLLRLLLLRNLSLSTATAPP